MKYNAANPFLAMMGGASWIDADNTYENSDAALIDLIRRARDEWMAAQNYFDNVSDPELVDYAIYGLEAAKRKYMYLLNQARAGDLRIDLNLET